MYGVFKIAGLLEVQVCAICNFIITTHYQKEKFL